jgi:hypothetical protein
MERGKITKWQNPEPSAAQLPITRQNARICQKAVKRIFNTTTLIGWGVFGFNKQILPIAFFSADALRVMYFYLSPERGDKS